jgi:type IV secretion system protein VirB5
MSIGRFRALPAFAVLALGTAPAVQAQWAVVDVQAISQLVQQAQTLQSQLQTARAQLLQAEQVLQSMSGSRGMQNLLSTQPRNYLPESWEQLSSSWLSGSGALAGPLQSAIAADAILGPDALASLTPADRQRIEAARRWVALHQVIGREALSVTSNRFGSLQGLIGAIGSAVDQKAILDLQARISSELAMLQNEQSKLEVLYRTADAEQSAGQQQDREQVIAGHGRFGSRFQPVP